MKRRAVPVLVWALPGLLARPVAARPLAAQAADAPVDAPAELRAELPAARLSGQATLRFWGLEIYQASLWVGPGFSAAGLAQARFALSLAYRRRFQGADIAQRSLTEMRRQAPLSEQQAGAWAQQMAALFPDVQAGDRITGLHQPGRGARFWHNGRALGELRDPLLAERFFAIWLSPRTSEPDLRRALLAQAAAPAGAAP